VTYLHRIGPVLLLAGVFGVGCNKDDSAIRTYSAPKDEPAQSPSMAANTVQQPSPSDAQPAAPALMRWTLPAGWKQTGGASDMRYATIEVSVDPRAELTVVPLGPESADLSRNLGRWAGQLKLPAPTDADLSKFVTQTQVSGEQAKIVNMTGSAESGSPPAALLAAIVPHGGQVWFFTIKAPEPVVTVQKANFETFIHSIQFTTDASASGAVTDTRQSPPGGESTSPSNSASYRLASWHAPQGWQEQPGSNSMRVTSFRVMAGDQQGEVIISRIPQGHSGTLVDNYNRWRGQVGLGPITDQAEAHSQSGTVGDLPAMFVTFVGPKTDEPAKEVMIAMTIVGGDDWFIKLIGPESLVSSQKDVFNQFVNSLKFTPESK
jgi:hypothetical protein